MAVTVEQERGQSGGGRELSIDTLELYVEAKGVLVSTGPEPFDPFGL